MKYSKFFIGLTVAVIILGCGEEKEILQPVADAGPDRTVNAGEWVQLDGSKSYDPEGRLIFYTWSFESLPAGSSAKLNDTGIVNPSFQADVAGQYIVRLIVDNGLRISEPDTVIINAMAGKTNTPPVADAGPDQSVSSGSFVQLDGSGSTDSDGDMLTYLWAFINLPPGSKASLNNPEIVNPSFLADVPGTYVVRLIVNDGKVNSAPDTVTITASAGNAPPVADAGADQNVATGSIVQMDGSGSNDPDGDLITYSWSFVSLPAGSRATLNDPGIVNPSFTADADGIYVLRLTVSDGLYTSSPDFITVTASTVNVAPVADAGADQYVLTGSIVRLDGSGSRDANGDALTYSWSFTSRPVGSSATLLNPDSAEPSFIADVSGTYVIQLIVNDGTENSAPDTVAVIAVEGNVRPIADAGLDQNVLTGSIVQLDGSGSTDANGDSLTYNWWFSSIPVGSTATLSDPTAINPTFVADLSGSYVIKLTVNDGVLTSDADTVVITANSLPVADAGPDRNVYVADTVGLNGAGSFDPDGDILEYHWALISVPAGSSATLSNPNSINPDFVPDVSGTYIVQLIVSDGKNQSAPDIINVNASDCTPVANPQGPMNAVYNGDTVVMDGTQSNSICGRQIVGYSWVMTNKPPNSSAVLSGANTATPTFVADVPGVYELMLVVSDSKGIRSNPEQVWVGVDDCMPWANPQGPMYPVYNGDTIVMDGTQSFSFHLRATDSGIFLGDAEQAVG